MNKFKKIGLTALAASLVSVSAQAGEMSVSGSASINVEGYSGEHLNAGSGFSMGNQLTFSGSGELDNGMTVSLSFILDQGDDSSAATTAVMAGAPFDSHSVTVSSDALGTLKFSGEGGSSAQSALDGTAAGDIWDNGFGISSPKASDAGNNSMLYTLPSLMDDLAVTASYSPSRAGQEGATALGLVYSGVDGLTLTYATGEDKTIGSQADADSMKASYAIGSVTLSASQTEYDSDTGNDDTVTSYNIAYTVSDDLSVGYGSETHETEGSSVDEEVSGLNVSYTSGGMTITAASIEAEGIDHTAGASGEDERWKISASFAF